MKLPFDKPKLPLDKLKLPHRKADEAANGAPPASGRKKKRKKLKKPVIIAAAVVVLGGAAVAHHFLANKKGDEVQSYIEASAERQDIRKTLSATGTIQPANQYDVTSSVQGDVLSCTFEEGGTVLPDGWRAVEVETGLSDDTSIEITSGLSEGDTVYVPQIQAQSSSDGDSMMPGGDMGGMPGGGAPGGGGMPGGGGGAPGGGGGGMP